MENIYLNSSYWKRSQNWGTLTHAGCPEKYPREKAPRKLPKKLTPVKLAARKMTPWEMSPKKFFY